MQTIREKYADLKLRVLERVEISDKDWNFLELGARDACNREFHDHLPIVVAQFQEAAAQEIMAWAAAQEEKHVFEESFSSSPLSALEEYEEDIRGVHGALLGSPGVFRNDGFIGKFTYALSPSLHMDSGDNCPIYISRLGSLEIQYVRWAEVRALPDGEREKIEHLISSSITSLRTNLSLRMQEELRGQEVLKPLPLGAVALFLSGNGNLKGTPHCSEWIPEGSAKHSALIHSQLACG